MARAAARPAPGFWAEPQMTTADRAVRILVVEDCPATADQLHDVLAARGFDVQVAHDASAGFIQAIWFRPAIVLVALTLAGPVGQRLPGLFAASPRRTFL